MYGIGPVVEVLDNVEALNNKHYKSRVRDHWPYLLLFWTYTFWSSTISITSITGPTPILTLNIFCDSTISITSTTKWVPFGVNCEVNTDALPNYALKHYALKHYDFLLYALKYYDFLLYAFLQYAKKQNHPFM